MRAERSFEEGAPVCRLLRAKTAFGTLVGDTTPLEPWHTGASRTAVYWCLATMTTAGPDDGLAHATACRAGRCCYQMEAG
jgi:hypothetical protein